MGEARVSSARPDQRAMLLIGGGRGVRARALVGTLNQPPVVPLVVVLVTASKWGRGPPIATLNPDRQAQARVTSSQLEIEGYLA